MRREASTRLLAVVPLTSAWLRKHPRTVPGRSAVRRLRRALALVAGASLLIAAVAVAADFSPNGGPYSSCSTAGSQVSFGVDLQTQEIKDFTLNGYPYFKTDRFSFIDGKWQFRHGDSKYYISGDWVGPGEVQGTLSNANSPTGALAFCARG